MLIIVKHEVVAMKLLKFVGETARAVMVIQTKDDDFHHLVYGPRYLLRITLSIFIYLLSFTFLIFFFPPLEGPLWKALIV